MWEIGYANLLMLLATIPTYESEDEPKKKKKDKDIELDFTEDTKELSNFIKSIS